MNKLSDFLQGVNIVKEVESNVNGRVYVIKSLAWGTYLQVGGLTQSGGVVYEVWQTTLKKLKTENLPVGRHGLRPKNVLILGLGGGSAAKLVRKLWPKTRIVGVDIDPVIVELGKKYLGLEESNVETVISDAEKYLKLASSVGGHNAKHKIHKYDLILVDLYVGDEFPKKFEEMKFLKLVSQLLTNNGLAVFNRLYYGDKRKETEKFSTALEKVFSKVDRVFPEANLMFVCRNLS